MTDITTPAPTIAQTIERMVSATAAQPITVTQDRGGLAGVNYFFRWRHLFLPVLSLHHWSTITQSDAEGVRSSGSGFG